MRFTYDQEARDRVVRTFPICVASLVLHATQERRGRHDVERRSVAHGEQVLVARHHAGGRAGHGQVEELLIIGVRTRDVGGTGPYLHGFRPGRYSPSSSWTSRDDNRNFG